MKYVIGIDGGGTKTDFALCDEQGNIVVLDRFESIAPLSFGSEYFLRQINEFTEQKLQEHNIDKKMIEAVCVGVPGFDEVKETDEKIATGMAKLFTHSRTVCVNDCVVAWAGALKMKSGINMVAGTGAIGYGRDDLGNEARSNGWSEMFSDEGSCYWLGIRSVGLYCKQSDGRVKKDALFDIFNRELGLEAPFDMIKYYERDVKGSRKNTAALQRYLRTAALAGDESALALYSEAAKELAISIMAVRRNLRFEGDISVSLTGGLFCKPDIVSSYIIDLLNRQDKEYRLVDAFTKPVGGAAIIACESAGMNINLFISHINRELEK